MDKSKDTRMVLISNSVYSVLIGIGITVILPQYAIYALIFNTVGVGGICYYATTWSRFDKIFRNLKIGINDAYYPILKSKKSTEYSSTYKFTLPTGIDVEEIKKNQGAIEQSVGKKVNIEYINKGLFIIEVYKKDEQWFFDYEKIELKGNVPILIGKDRKGNLIWFDLAEGTEPHMYIAGNTGCGKSTGLRSMLVNLILTTSVILHLVDLKHGAEFSLFRRSSHVKSFATTLDEAENVLKAIIDEVERRYTLFAQYDVNDITAYNKKFKNNKLSYELLVIDEMVDFQARKDLAFLLEVLAAKARGAGIHMLMSTQRPDKDILNGRIKSNVTNVLGLKTSDGVNSRIVIDENGLENLKGKGHGILVRHGEKTEIQTPKLDIDIAKELIKHTYVDKPLKKDIKQKDEKIELDIADISEVFDKW